MTVLSPTESAVLAEVVEGALGTGRRIVDPVAVEAGCRDRGVDHDQWFVAVGALKARGLVAAQTAPPSQVVLVAATNPGILHHLEAIGYDLAAARHRLAAAVLAAQLNQPLALADAVHQPALLVECLLDGWVDQRLVVYSPAPGRRFRVHQVNLDPRGWP